METRLEVLASDDDPRISRALGEHAYRRILGLLDRHYQLVVVDTGTGILDSSVQGLISEADQIVLVMPPALDGVRVAAATLDWLDEHGCSALVRRGIAVINAVRDERVIRLDQVEDHFSRRCAGVVRVPWDPTLQAGGHTKLGELAAGNPAGLPAAGRAGRPTTSAVPAHDRAPSPRSVPRPGQRPPPCRPDARPAPDRVRMEPTCEDLPHRCGRRRPAATAVTLVPLPAEASGSGGSRTVVSSAVATVHHDGRTRTDSDFDVRRVAFGLSAATNTAVAYARCRHCRALAVSFQIVVARGVSADLAVNNHALAVTDRCTRCEAVARAYQWVVVTGADYRLSPHGQRELAQIGWQLKALVRSRPDRRGAGAQGRGAGRAGGRVLTQEIRRRPVEHVWSSHAVH